MKVKILIGFVGGLVAILLGGAYWFFVVNMVHGSGIELAEDRELEAFHQIDLGCASDVDVSIGEFQSITVTGDDNIVPLIRTEVSDGRMLIDCDKRFRTKLGLKVRLVVAKLDSIKISGSGDVISGGLEGQDLTVSISGSGGVKIASFSGISSEMKISGSGDVEVGKLSVKKLVAGISGSGSMKAAGEVEVLDGKINGSGSLNLKELMVNQAEVRVSGSGDIAVNVGEVLEGRISGSGNIFQHGKANPLVKVSGSGSVTRK